MKRERRSLGPQFTNLNCPACGGPYLQGLLDRNGGAYLSCLSGCRFRILSCSVETLAVFRFFSNLLNDEEFRAAWSKARNGALDLVRSPAARVKAEEAKEVRDVRGSQ